MTEVPEVDVAVVVTGTSPRQVWDALADARVRSVWWPWLDLDASPGGRFEERWTGDDGTEAVTRGRVLASSPGRLLRLTWADDGWPAETEVEITLEARDDGTAVRVRHTGWDRLPDGDALAAAHRDGWRRHLSTLRRLGPALRHLS